MSRGSGCHAVHLIPIPSSISKGSTIHDGDRKAAHGTEIDFRIGGDIFVWLVDGMMKLGRCKKCFDSLILEMYCNFLLHVGIYSRKQLFNLCWSKCAKLLKNKTNACNTSTVSVDYCTEQLIFYGISGYLYSRATFSRLSYC